MDSQVSGLGTFMRKASWRTLLRTILFAADLIMSTGCLHQAMSLTFFAVNPGATSTFSALPDIVYGDIGSSADGGLLSDSPGDLGILMILSGEARSFTAGFN